jgi:hypothetical protein
MDSILAGTASGVTTTRRTCISFRFYRGQSRADERGVAFNFPSGEIIYRSNYFSNATVSLHRHYPHRATKNAASTNEAKRLKDNVPAFIKRY